MPSLPSDIPTTKVLDLNCSRQDIIRGFVENSVRVKATDIHISEDRKSPIRCRIAGRLVIASNWPEFTGADGLPTALCPSYAELLAEFFGDPVANTSPRLAATYRFAGYQVRLQILNDASEFRGAHKGGRLLVRVQPSSPPELSEFISNRSAVSALMGARGLVVVAGPMGGGKTTLANALALAWADNPARPGHIISIEDPVEYRLKPKLGSITQLEANLTNNQDDKRPTLDCCESSIRRGDIDGLFIGEVLNSSILKTALKYGCTKEPVVTTLHAGSISDALMRLFNVAAETYGMEDLAKARILKNLHCIVYVTLAFDKDSKPIPVTRLYQIRNVQQRNELNSLSALQILSNIEESMKKSGQAGIIGEQEAISVARVLGATEESLALAAM